MMIVTLRPATEKDNQAIHALINTARINPLGINWRRFLLAVDEQNRMIGCGQIKPHASEIRELASIAVWPEHRMKGIGSLIIKRLIEDAASPLYLTCRAELQSYYNRFGFNTITPEQMPGYFKRLWTISRVLKPLIPPMGSLSIMRCG